jgi:8-amino-7-oxononanoate synthase
VVTIGATSGDVQREVTEAVFEQVRQAVPEGLECELLPDTSLFEIGLDSVMRMDVVNRIEQTMGIRFAEEDLYDLETCHDLIECVTRAVSGKQTDGYAADASTPEKPRKLIETLPEHWDVEQFPECVAFQERLTAVAASGYENPFFRVNEQVTNVTATINDRKVVSYASFDYLGMASDPEVTSSAKEAIGQFGTSASASRLVGGNTSIIEDLDLALAEFVGTESAIIFPSGYGTNASLLGHLFGEDDLILYDELAHNSIVQGSLLSKGQRRSFPHNDFEFVDKLLGDVRGRFRRVVVAVEGVYSMDGDYPDLPRFVEIKKRHKALLYVDEAHSLGVMGATGRGICEHFNVDPGDGDLWMGTISKALGSGGGYVAGRASLIQYLKYTTPALVFATGVSPANAAAALTAVRLLEKNPSRVTLLRERAELFLRLAKESGLNTGNSKDTAVIPVILGDSMQCLQVSHALLQQGINALPILYPAVPENATRVRFFITANHTEDQIRRAVQLVTEAAAAG